ncbi:MAG: SPOR domain-containing protein [Chromatiales bacterium]|nr:SPOR domain-containing protein [Chromatiales bacterium]
MSNKEHRDDEELISDFDDLFADDELPPDAVDALNEIDALLDDAERIPEVGLNGELFADIPVLDDELDPETIVEEPPTSMAQPSASPSSGEVPQGPATIALDKRALIAGGAVVAFSLLFSLVALWLVSGFGSELETLNRSVTELQQTLQRRSEPATHTPLAEQVNQLGQRVDELSVIVEGPVGHLRERNQQELDALSQRLDLLERRQSALTLETQKSARVSDPVPDHRPPVAAETGKAATPVSVPTTAESQQLAKDEWVINLLSVTSAKTANDELARLRALGIRADKQIVNKDGKSWYRLQVTGFDSYEGAKAYIETVEQQTGFKSAWVGRP